MKKKIPLLETGLKRRGIAEDSDHIRAGAVAFPTYAAP